VLKEAELKEKASASQLSNPPERYSSILIPIVDNVLKFVFLLFSRNKELSRSRRNRWVDASKRLEIQDLDDATRESLPSFIRSIRNFDIEPPIFIYPPEFVEYSKRSESMMHIDSYRSFEAMQLNVELKDTCDAISINQNGKRKYSEVGIGVFAVRDIPSGFRLPVWGTVGRPNEFRQETLDNCDRKCDIRFYMGGRNERFILLMHHECVAGYINDCSDPYSRSDSNCKLISMYPCFNRTAAHLYTFVETTRIIHSGEQLLMFYGRGYWR